MPCMGVSSLALPRRPVLSDVDSRKLSGYHVVGLLTYAELLKINGMEEEANTFTLHYTHLHFE